MIWIINIDCHESQNKSYDTIYLIFLITSILIYLGLLYMDPGKKKKNSDDSFLVEISI